MRSKNADSQSESRNEYLDFLPVSQFRVIDFFFTILPSEPR